MEHKLIPCVEGDDAFVEEKLNAITDAKIDSDFRCAGLSGIVRRKAIPTMI